MSGLEGDLGDQCLGPPVHFPEADTDSSPWQLLKVKLGLGLEKIVVDLQLNSPGEIRMRLKPETRKDHVFPDCSIKQTNPILS